ncbi:MAG: hypothetical protein V3G42_14950 [Oscillospiraceae bacterium]
MMNNKKKLSIITNFGCHYTCPYCVVKNTGIHIPETTIKSLDLLLDVYKTGDYTGISVSGGGDPMYEYEKHTDYYEKLFSICSENHIPLGLHTSYIKEGLPYSHFDLIAFHLPNTRNITRVNVLDCGSAAKRIVFVADETLTEQKIDLIYEIYQRCQHISQLSFRQMILPDYSTAYYCHDYLKAGHKSGKWHYIEQCDYNTYFVNGKTSERYEDFRMVKKDADDKHKVDPERLIQHVMQSNLSPYEKTYLEMLIETRDCILKYQQGFLYGMAKREKEIQAMLESKWIPVADKGIGMKFPCLTVNSIGEYSVIDDICCACIGDDFRVYSSLYEPVFQSFALNHEFWKKKIKTK